MVIKNSSRLSKEYFQSYFKLRMNTRGCSLDEARDQTYEELFSQREERFGKATYQHFLEAYEEMKQK